MLHLEQAWHLNVRCLLGVCEAFRGGGIQDFMEISWCLRIRDIPSKATGHEGTCQGHYQPESDVKPAVVSAVLKHRVSFQKDIGMDGLARKRQGAIWCARHDHHV
jgi:hypothetical protein